MADCEYLDCLDPMMRRVGVASRVEVHRAGIWHQTFHCWVLIDGSARRPCAVFQMRSPRKSRGGGKLDTAAAGHLLAGETARDGCREIEEETGIRANFDELLPLGIHVEPWQEGDHIDLEFQHMFMLRRSDLGPVRLQPEEVSQLVAIPIADGRDLFSGRASTISAREITPDGKVGGLVEGLGVDDFMGGHRRGYYARGFRAALAIARGERPVCY